MTFSYEIRKIALQKVFLDGIEAIPKIAMDIGVGESTIYFWMNESSKGRSIFDYHKPRGKSSHPRMPSLHREYLLDFIMRYPFAYVWEARNYLHHTLGKFYSANKIRSQLLASGITRQVLMTRAKQQSEPLRRLYKEFIKQFTKEQIMFLDESHCRPGDARRKYGYGIRGYGAFIPSSNVSHPGGSETACAIACMNSNGLVSATIYYNEIVNAEKFERNFKQEILPKLQSFPNPNSVLVMDNAPTHNREWIHEFCRKVGAIAVFLPPYSYDFSPIELMFHDCKSYIKRQYGSEEPNNSRLLGSYLLEGLCQVSSHNCKSFYRHCGYD
jgi:transposase